MKTNSACSALSLLFIYLIILTGCTARAEKEDAPAGPPPYDGPIIDMHLHAFPAQSPLFGMTHPPTLRGETYAGVATPEEQKEHTLEKIRENNIVKAMVAGGTGWYEDAPEIIVIGGDNPSADALRSQFESGRLEVIGEIAPFYQGIKADDPPMSPLFEVAAELGIPVGFHVLPGGPNGGIHSGMEMLQGMRAANASPLQMENVLVKHPEVKMYIMHGGWPYVDDVKALMYMHPQLYVDISVVNWLLPQEEFNSYIASLINAGFGDRIMYGTDQMVWPQLIDVGIATVNAAPITDEQKADIFYNNAARFLGLSEEEKARHHSSQ